MNIVALKMLTGDRAKYLGIVMGLTFASLLITQQAGIFVGLMSRTYGAITDAGGIDIWAMESNVQFIDDVKPMAGTELFRIRGVDGVLFVSEARASIIRNQVWGAPDLVVEVLSDSNHLHDRGQKLRWYGE